MKLVTCEPLLNKWICECVLTAVKKYWINLLLQKKNNNSKNKPRKPWMIQKYYEDWKMMKINQKKKNFTSKGKTIISKWEIRQHY